MAYIIGLPVWRGRYLDRMRNGRIFRYFKTVPEIIRLAFMMGVR